MRARAGLLLLSLGALPANDLVAKGAQGMVVSAHPLASAAGVQVLQAGGNAVDAAVAVAFALAVVHPQAGNLGGGGFLVVRMADGRTGAIDFREKAPKAAHRDMYLDTRGRVAEGATVLGALAAGVPGSPAGLLLARERFGKKPLAELIEPARKLAAYGFAVDHFLADDLNGDRKRLCAFASTAAVFFPDGTPARAGALLQQPDLAATLERIAKDGRAGFYGGKTADLIVAEMQRSGGIITHADLAGYQPVERAVLQGTYRGLDILTMPPPSSGGVALLQMLNVLEGFDLKAPGYGSARTVHLLVEAMKRAFADRSVHLGDPDFVPVPTAGLAAKSYAEDLRRGIDPQRASAVVKPGKPAGATHESGETTHFSVVDAEGNAASCTTTINASFGNRLVVAGAGFLLNNEMDDFAARPGEPNRDGLVVQEQNAIQPGKRMLSSMTPTIVLKDQKPFLVLGSPGSGRIINTVLQVLVNVVDHGMPVARAVAAPRLHHQWRPDHIVLEPLTLSPDTRAILEGMGHKFATKTLSIGHCAAILIDEKGMRHGAMDPRSGGAAVGY